MTRSTPQWTWVGTASGEPTSALYGFSVLLVKLLRDIRASKVDWKGWPIIAGFIALAFYLRNVTGIGEF